MNAKGWRDLGYKTLFFGNTVCLYRPLTGVAIINTVRTGEWMNDENVNEAPWIILKNGIKDAPKGIQLIAENIDKCYCDTAGVGLCDFCAGIRSY